MKNYDIRAYQYGVDPILFFKDTYDKISGELEAGEEARITINPEKFSEKVESVAGMASGSGLSVVSVKTITPDEAQIDVVKSRQYEVFTH